MIWWLLSASEGVKFFTPRRAGTLASAKDKWTTFYLAPSTLKKVSAVQMFTFTSVQERGSCTRIICNKLKWWQNNYRVQLASQKNHVLQFNLRSAVFSYACIVWADWGGNYETWFSLELDETSGRDLPDIPTGLTSLGHLLTLLKLARSVISTYFAYLLPSTLEQLRDNKGKDKTHIKRISL